jgi:hypothetical protein
MSAKANWQFQVLTQCKAASRAEVANCCSNYPNRRYSKRPGHRVWGGNSGRESMPVASAYGRLRLSKFQLCTESAADDLEANYLIPSKQPAPKLASGPVESRSASTRSASIIGIFDHFFLLFYKNKNNSNKLHVITWMFKTESFH